MTKEGGPGDQDGAIDSNVLHSGMLAGLTAAGVSVADLADFQSGGGGSMEDLLERLGMQMNLSLSEGEEMELTFDS